MSKRELWIDNLKAFTIFAVIVGHCLDGYLKANMFPESNNAFYGIWYFIYSYHMPLFFIISGYTFSLAYLDENNNLKTRRYIRQSLNIFLIYVIWGLILWVLKMMMASFVNTKYDISDLKNMFIKPLGNYWYLYVLFILYMITGILKLNRWNKTALFGIAAAVAVVIGYLSKESFTIYKVLYHLFFFIVGMILCANPKLMNNVAIFIVSIIVAVGLWIACILIKLDLRGAVLRPLMALSMSMIFIYIFKNIFIINSGFIRRCGMNCIYIYLTHFYITAANRQLLPMIGIHNAWVSLVINTFMALLISLGLSVICNKLSVTDIFFRPIRIIDLVKDRVSK